MVLNGMARILAFWDHVRSAPGTDPAFLRPGKPPVTYANLAASVEHWRARFAQEARRIGIERLLVGIEIAPEPDLIACYLAALTDGHPVLICEPGGLAPDTAISLAYRPNLLCRMLNGRCDCLARDDDPVGLGAELRLLLSTSGTTGDPKLVRLSAENIASNADAIAEYLGLTAMDRGVTSLPLHYSYGLSVLHSHLAVGAAVLLTDMSVADTNFLGVAANAGVTGLALVPHQVDLMLAQADAFEALPLLARITQAGGKLPPATVRTMGRRAAAGGWKFYVMYGQTEAAPRMAYLPPEDAIRASDTIGRAIPGGRIWLSDASGAEIVGALTAGELVYSGPNVMLGYARMRGDLALGRTVNDLRTGDIAERTPDGYFRIVGRAHRFAKLFGLRISLDQIEADLGDRGIAAYCEAPEGRLVVMLRSESDTTAVRSDLAQRLGVPSVALIVTPITEDPRLPSGKPDRKLLKRLADRLALDAASASSRQHGSIAEAFRAGTRHRTIRPEDTFVSLGGDSLGYLHVVLALEAHLGRVPAGWEQMTLAEIEALVPSPQPARSSVESGSILRLVAISCVVIFHLTLWPVAGGTFVLVLLIGHSLAQFQREAMAKGAPLRLLRSLLVPILPIYFLLLLSFDALRGGISNEMYLLLGNVPRRLDTELFEPYWFISLYAQIIAVVALIVLLPPVQRMVRHAPFNFGIGATFLTATLSMVFQAVFLNGTVPITPAENGIGPNAIRTLPVALPFVFLGWSIFLAREWPQRLACIAAMVFVITIFPLWTINHLVLIVVSGMFLLSRFQLPLPVKVVRATRTLAGATMFVYLLHTGVIHVVKHATGIYDSLGPVLSVLIVLPACFGLGIAVKFGFDRAEAVFRRRFPHAQRESGRD